MLFCLGQQGYGVVLLHYRSNGFGCVANGPGMEATGGLQCFNRHGCCINGMLRSKREKDIWIRVKSNSPSL